MSLRRTVVLSALALAATTVAPLAVAPSASAAACGTVVSATKNGAPISASWIQTSCDSGGRGESSSLLWNVWTGPWADGGSGATNNLGSAALADTYVITLDTGTDVPRVTDTKGGAVSVTRAKQGDGHWHVTITAKPVLATGGCDQSTAKWTCPSPAPQQWDGYLGGNITDYASWEDEAQRNAFFGMDYSSNIDAGSIPPQIVKDDAGVEMVLLEFANSHLDKGGNLFRGNASIVIPNGFLKEVYGVDDPASLTGAGLAPDLTGSGAGTVTVTDIGGALRVDVANMTFSKRNLKVHRGNIRPGKPGKLSADRKNASAVKLSYERAKARGSKIKGYTATCVAKSGPKHVVTLNDKRPSTTVTGLHANTAYTCKVRARSKAGNGGWTKVAVAKKA